MYYIAIIIISWKMGKRLGVNWLNACTVPEKFRSIAHSPEEKELTEGDPVLKASVETITILYSMALPRSPEEKEPTEDPVLRARAGL